MLNTPFGWLLILVWAMTVAAFLLRLDMLKLVILCILLSAALIFLILRGQGTGPTKPEPTVLVLGSSIHTPERMPTARGSSDHILLRHLTR